MWCGYGYTHRLDLHTKGISDALHCVSASLCFFSRVFTCIALSLHLPIPQTKANGAPKTSCWSLVPLP